MIHELLKYLQSRQTDSRWGIGTALHYLKGIEPCLAGGLCPVKAFAIADAKLWEKELSDAASRLTYCEKHDAESIVKSVREGTDITKGAILEYDCILSTKSIDRDGDIVESEGLEIDPDMPGLWQHLQLSPVGRLVKVLAQTGEQAKCRFAIADTELGRDTATLTKFGALRKSMGFRPVEASPITRGSGNQKSVTGWHVTKAAVFEGSLVSIPANADAKIIRTYEREFDGVCTVAGKGILQSPLVKAWAGDLYAKRPVIGIGFRPAQEPTPDQMARSLIAKCLFAGDEGIRALELAANAAVQMKRQKEVAALRQIWSE